MPRFTSESILALKWHRAVTVTRRCGADFIPGVWETLASECDEYLNLARTSDEHEKILHIKREALAQAESAR